MAGAREEPVVKRMMLTAAAASVAELVTYPIDMSTAAMAPADSDLVRPQDQDKTATAGRKRRDQVDEARHGTR